MYVQQRDSKRFEKVGIVGKIVGEEKTEKKKRRNLLIPSGINLSHNFIESFRRDFIGINKITEIVR